MDRVVVPVVVRDQHGRIVGDLKQGDFEVLDDGKTRTLSGFSVARRAPLADGGIDTPNLVGDGSAPVSLLPQRYIVFLFDDLHLNTEDLVHVKKAASEALAAVLTGADVAAVVSLSGAVNSGLTQDREKLQAAIASVQTRGTYTSNAADCPKIDYYQADLIVNKSDGEAEQDAARQELMCNPGIDLKRDYDVALRLADAAARQAVLMGRQDIETTYANLGEFVRRMSTLPGQRILVMVSPGFLPLEADGQTEESLVIDRAAQANVIISALDARGLYTTELDASQHSPSLNTVNGAGNSVSLQGEYLRAGRMIAGTALAALTDGTGGTFFENNNDLEAGFRKLAEPPEVMYLLELPLDGIKADGSYHKLKVTVNRGGVIVQARRGYFIAKRRRRSRGPTSATVERPHRERWGWRRIRSGKDPDR